MTRDGGPMRVMVTGGTGYLGRVLVDRCASGGDEVHALWHRRSPAPHPSVTWHRSDLRDLEATSRLVERVQPAVVIHTAYRNLGHPEQEQQLVTGAASGEIARAGAAVGARLVHLSTDVVFDGRRAHGGYREDEPTHPITAYGRAKERAEHLVATAHPDALIVRTSLIYGGAEPGPQEHLVRRALDGGDPNLVFFTDEIRSVVQVDDLADAVIELAGTSISGVLHVAGADPVSRHEFAALLARSFGRAGADLPAGSSAGLDPPRPQNCTLDSSAARRLLPTTRLRGAHEVLAG